MFMLMPVYRVSTLTCKLSFFISFIMIVPTATSYSLAPALIAVAYPGKAREDASPTISPQMRRG